MKTFYFLLIIAGLPLDRLNLCKDLMIAMRNHEAKLLNHDTTIFSQVSKSSEKSSSS